MALGWNRLDGVRYAYCILMAANSGAAGPAERSEELTMSPQRGTDRSDVP